MKVKNHTSRQGFTTGGVLTLPMVSAEKLDELYWEEGLTQTEIADRLGLSDAAISRWMDKHDIASSEQRRERQKQAVRKGRAKFSTTEKGYEVWRDSPPTTGTRNSTVTVFHHTLLAVAEGADPHRLFGRTSPEVVHHKNGVPWDNRPENVQTVSREKHNKAHHPSNVGEIA